MCARAPAPGLWSFAGVVLLLHVTAPISAAAQLGHQGRGLLQGGACVAHSDCNPPSGGCINGRCICDLNYAGANCQTCNANYYNWPTCLYCTAEVTCRGRGSCRSADGACACFAGYAGNTCQFSDAETCSGLGTADALGRCTCRAGYAGPACQFDVRSTCSNNGAPRYDGSCLCKTGFGGASCNQCGAGFSGYPNCRTCNGTVCQELPNCSGHGSLNANGSCTCSAGFGGDSCDRCALTSYAYPSCFTCIAETTCSNHGRCGSNGLCVCNDGWTGAACEAPVPGGGSSSAACSGTGQQRPDGSCYCGDRYAGSRCERCGDLYYSWPTCNTFCNATTTCNGRGTCSPLGSCQCVGGWSGYRCDVPPAPAGGGTGGTPCTATTATGCALGSAGPSCEFSSAATCSGQGAPQRDGSCVCFPGYAGRACNTCAPYYGGYPNCQLCTSLDTCGGHGLCNEAADCICDKGYNGRNCQRFSGKPSRPGKRAQRL